MLFGYDDQITLDGIKANVSVLLNELSKSEKELVTA